MTEVNKRVGNGTKSKSTYDEFVNEESEVFHDRGKIRASNSNYKAKSKIASPEVPSFNRHNNKEEDESPQSRILSTTKRVNSPYTPIGSSKFSMDVLDQQKRNPTLRTMEGKVRNSPYEIREQTSGRQTKMSPVNNNDDESEYGSESSSHDVNFFKYYKTNKKATDKEEELRTMYLLNQNL